MSSIHHLRALDLLGPYHTHFAAGITDKAYRHE
jgi:hypothetical protein